MSAECLTMGRVILISRTELRKFRTHVMSHDRIGSVMAVPHNRDELVDVAKHVTRT
jgi:hypothetical protein